MTPNDIPASIIAMGAVPIRVAYAKQMPTDETMRKLIAHYWPAIREHFITTIAADLTELADDPATPDRQRIGLNAAAYRIHKAEDGGY